jgi:ankyrin repeat protein
MTKPPKEKPLVEASAGGREDEVDALLAAGVDIHSKRSGESALMVAAAQGHRSILIKLLKAGARVTDTGPKGMTALSFAATRGKIDPEAIALLVEAGSPVDGRDLHVSIALREVETVRLLLSKRPDVNRRFDWPSFPLGHVNKGDTPLLVAVTDTMSETFGKSGAPFGTSKPVERLAIIDLLLAAGADVNIPRLRTGATPLILATFFDEAEIAQRLIRAGADPTAEFECKMVRSPFSKPRTLQDKTLSAVTLARMKPRNKKVRKLLLGEA